MLEAGLRKDNCFVTLTYADDKLPTVVDKYGEVRSTLKPKDLQDWLKRFRKAISPDKVRFYAVGEYGDVSSRPHYHVALFGFPNCAWIQSRYSKSRSKCCTFCDTIRDTWGHGQVYLGTLEQSSAGYIAGYVTKKMTARDDERLQGRAPEFGRMSRRPGVGADAMDDVASTFMEFDLDTTQADVPSALRHGSRELPLGRYLQRRLRERVGKDAEAPASVLAQVEEELSPLRVAAFDGSRSFKAEIVKAGDGKVANMESRNRVFKKRGNL